MSKGSFPRTFSTSTYRDNFDSIDWSPKICTCGFRCNSACEVHGDLLKRSEENRKLSSGGCSLEKPNKITNQSKESR